MRAPALACIALLCAALASGGCGDGQGSSASHSTSQPSAAPGSSGGEERGGEASIEEFGSEASGVQRTQILASFSAYLSAIAAEDHDSACSHLSVGLRRSLTQLAAKPLASKGCAAILAKLLSPTAAPIARAQAEGEIARVRVEGERAFVVFHAPGAELYQLAMVREGGEWKAGSAAASVLVPSLQAGDAQPPA